MNCSTKDQNGKQQAEISVQKVIQSELSQLKDKAKVYHKQPNSNVYFLSSVEKEMAKSKRALDELTSEYQHIEDKNVNSM
ncbi:asparagine synthetase domain-containing 1 [Plakobranchus ocellatus]|uniref:Asparagine synthetase domain-containing 1 n=1 Tax=Plakobranchus ocellatus TaxID=259542 RepID=A0AAV3XY83_9GAST|nr:asparagine synthetase domain-containing 1 [Plakobranchus ocellatus]